MSLVYRQYLFMTRWLQQKLINFVSADLVFGHCTIFSVVSNVCSEEMLVCFYGSEDSPDLLIEFLGEKKLKY